MKPAHSIIPTFLFLFFCLLGGQVHAANVPEPVGDIYVQDFAQVLTAEQKKELHDLGIYLDDHTGAQIAVLSVESLQGQQVEEYALDAFRQYGLGDPKKNNGVLLLLALNERKIRIEVGYGLEGALPDGKVGRILQSYSLPYLEADDFGTALTNTYKQLFNEVSAEYKLDKQMDTKEFKYEESSGEGPSLLTIVIFSLIALGIIFLDVRFLGGALTLSILRIIAVILSRGGGGSGGGGSRGGGGGSSGGGGASRGW
ncbi:TPM domain-containing protein [Bacillus sp. FSL K6-3431]|uniref:TPM domain-containing protein n=1 Tax=Bacillus sp. FSL K6-3431 TaxID=2921500 RepID=UPI0030F931B5